MFYFILFITIAIETGLGASPQFTDGAIAANDQLVANSVTPDGKTQDGWQPEPQEPTGKYTTATEVKPILSMTKAHWAAVREYEGKDLLYLSNLLAWRCGLHEIRYSINQGPAKIWEMEKCHLNTGQPNALTMETVMPYKTFDPGFVNSLTLMLVYDDASTENATFKRSDILMP
ncbi:MAG TPA: hypothetical protein DD729_04700 [Rhodobacteraceae bacterium]|jgi:hypothetical protein|nr:hypothetical protein [Paracoccaceae bacterium]